jgi:hypothetical protein
LYEDDFFYGGIKAPDNDYEEQTQGAEPLLKFAEEKAKKELEKFENLRSKSALLKKLLNEQ